MGKLFQANCAYSPFDVVGWRGNYAPCKYNLQLYNTIGSISYDHPDPSIFTVLTAKSHIEGYSISLIAGQQPLILSCFLPGG